MARPVIALLTDFGTRDHYAGTMKGVVLGICPDATLVDISHDIAAARRARPARSSSPPPIATFPAGTIFLVVVDPGVGSTRRGIAAEAGDYRFVAPDNGVLTAVLDEHPPKRVVELTERKYARPTVSRTFEGRDRFAPAAAWLAKGIDLPALGRPAGAIQRLDIPQPRVERRTHRRRGAARRSLRQPDHEHRSQDVRASCAGGAARHPRRRASVSRVVSTYADAAPGEVCALFGSTDHLEIAANGASAADALDLRPRRRRARRPPRVIRFAVSTLPDLPDP